MPIYAYRCAECGHAKDALQKLSDAPLTTCPACHQETFQKQVTAAGFQLKGSGWYATDFKNAAAAPAPAAAKDDKNTSQGGSSESAANASSPPPATAAASSAATAPGSSASPNSGPSPSPASSA